MGLHLSQEVFTGTTQGESAANLARLAARAGTETNAGIYLFLYQRLSSMMCWDAAIYCAWSANAVDATGASISSSTFNQVSADSYQTLFGNQARKIDSKKDFMALPAGYFIGFVNEANNRLRHVMISLGAGQAAGNKSDCVLSSGHSIGWEVLDTSDFFGKDSALNTNASTFMIAEKIRGQKI